MQKRSSPANERSSLCGRQRADARSETLVQYARTRGRSPRISLRSSRVDARAYARTARRGRSTYGRTRGRSHKEEEARPANTLIGHSARQKRTLVQRRLLVDARPGRRGRSSRDQWTLAHARLFQMDCSNSREVNSTYEENTC
ncbi:hypothetical protein LR48_Vigan11g094000 [Vigna angularis]|uniref:Uncharacterized protein n=1 Tax=Phaseolus angularis TaxID=3914 RepID=A0A0L9VSR3_PHAAN|nr:hypothetical protein LR48_Vigan11g094000 [Vigna angularis]